MLLDLALRVAGTGTGLVWRAVTWWCWPDRTQARIEALERRLRQLEGASPVWVAQRAVPEVHYALTLRGGRIAAFEQRPTVPCRLDGAPVVGPEPEWVPDAVVPASAWSWMPTSEAYLQRASELRRAVPEARDGELLFDQSFTLMP